MTQLGQCLPSTTEGGLASARGRCWSFRKGFLALAAIFLGGCAAAVHDEAQVSSDEFERSNFRRWKTAQREAFLQDSRVEALAAELSLQQIMSKRYARADMLISEWRGEPELLAVEQDPSDPSLERTVVKATAMINDVVYEVVAELQEARDCPRWRPWACWDRWTAEDFAVNAVGAHNENDGAVWHINQSGELEQAQLPQVPLYLITSALGRELVSLEEMAVVMAENEELHQEIEALRRELSGVQRKLRMEQSGAD